MATKEAIAIRTEQALARLTAAAAALSEKLAAAPLELVEYRRDPDELRADQLEGLAAWAENLLAAMPAPGAPEVEATDENAAPPKPLADCTVAELEALAAKRGILDSIVGTGADGRVLKADLIAAIIADEERAVE